MKYTVKIADITYEVEIEDLNRRPVLARIGDETFEVIPENGHAAAPSDSPQAAAVSQTAIQTKAGTASGPASGKSIVAPLPGAVTEVNVKVGDLVQSGQQVCVIDAMKMKNAIRATRAGKIANVAITAGQSVTHRQVLVEFES
ncbi:MAG: biotin/lipoyl-containing protein [Anaerolineales bacterium]|jgi:biotin carboxyl carrier protein|nr:biotin/lipoyl-containing protein [Anaerolineales bacterium]